MFVYLQAVIHSLTKSNSWLAGWWMAERFIHQMSGAPVHFRWHIDV